MASSSKKTLYVSLAADLGVATTKFVVAGMTGSSAMFSEGIHSLVDTSNELLLLLGLNRSQQPPDEDRPFGYGREQYFWSYVVALLIFVVGGGASVYEGVTHLRHPEPMTNPQWNYVVLGISALFGGYSLVVTWRAVSAERHGQPFWQALRTSKDSATVTVFLEDVADLLGLLIAFGGVFLGHVLHNQYADGVASVLIGLLLMTVAGLLARQSKRLLLGQGMKPAAIRHLGELTEADPAVVHARRIATIYLGPEEVTLIQSVVFRADLTMADLSQAIVRIQTVLKAAYPVIKHAYMQPLAPDKASNAA